MTETHIHHIVPRYAGGGDSLDNLVELTPTQHAMWHFASWQLWGDWRDELAWRGLASLIPHNEVKRQRLLRGRIQGGRTITPKKSKAARENQKKAAARMKELKKGVYALTREQSSLACKGKVWINNGEKNKRILPDQPLPEGWVKGRLTPWQS